MSVDVQARTEAVADKGGVRLMLARGLTRERIETALLPAAFMLLLVVLWEIASNTGVVDPVLVPAPTDIIDATRRLGNTYFFWDAVWVTAQEALLGFIIGVLAAYLVGTAVGLFPAVRRAIFPLVVAVEIVPRIALAPVFLSWFGLGIASKVAMAAGICFFPVLINVVLGLETVNKDAQKLLLPASLPEIFASLKVAITFALTGAIVAEYVGANEGLAVLLKTFFFQLLTAEGFAVILALSE